MFCLSPLSFASAKESGKEKQRQNGCLRPFCLPTHKNVTIILNFSFQKIVEHPAAENWESERRKKKENNRIETNKIIHLTLSLHKNFAIFGK
ncbi:MAG: hypothetical protein C4308_07605 [Chitinophagaceae bacterium]